MSALPGLHTATTARPAAGIREAGVPATGAAATALPATGMPATGMPATGLPATGLPATGLPATALSGAGAASVGAPAPRAPSLRASLWRIVTQALPTALGIVILNFLLLQLVPGDAADVIAAESGSATAETMAHIRERFGLDQPMLSQLLSYLGNLAHFNLGFSPRYNTPVLDLIMSRLPGTLLLTLVALGIAFVVGLIAGAIMSAWAGRWPDRVLSVVVLLLYSTPGFWIGLMAIVLFSVHLGWLPSGGSATIGASLHGFDLFWDRLRYLLLPAAALSTFFVAIYARLTRAAMLEVNNQDFVRTAAAKGLHPLRVQVVHILRNALIPITTVAGMHLGNLLGGSVVVETVFGWPGMGRLALEAVAARDFQVLLGVMLLASLVVIAANALIDLLHAWLDPRIQAR